MDWLLWTWTGCCGHGLVAVDIDTATASASSGSQVMSPERLARHHLIPRAQQIGMNPPSPEAQAQGTIIGKIRSSIHASLQTSADCKARSRRFDSGQPAFIFTIGSVLMNRTLVTSSAQRFAGPSLFLSFQTN